MAEINFDAQRADAIMPTKVNDKLYLINCPFTFNVGPAAKYLELGYNIKTSEGDKFTIISNDSDLAIYAVKECIMIKTKHSNIITISEGYPIAKLVIQ